MRWSITIQYQCMTVSALAGFVCFVKSSNHLMSNYFHYSTQRYHLSLHVTCFEAVKFAFKPSKGPFHDWTGWTVGGIELSLCFREIAVVSVRHQQWRQQRISRVPEEVKVICWPAVVFKHVTQWAHSQNTSIMDWACSVCIDVGELHLVVAHGEHIDRRKSFPVYIAVPVPWRWFDRYLSAVNETAHSWQVMLFFRLAGNRGTLSGSWQFDVFRLKVLVYGLADFHDTALGPTSWHTEQICHLAIHILIGKAPYSNCYLFLHWQPDELVLLFQVWSKLLAQHLFFDKKTNKTCRTI